VRAWFNAQPEDDFALSVITLGEISAGIAQLALRDREQARHLERWLRQTKQTFADRLLPVTTEVADCWGRLSPGQPLPTADGLIAATALIHDLTVVTRNVADFNRSGVAMLNPFDIPAHD